MEAPIAIGDVVAGKFAVQRIVARGAHGVVVLAKHLALLEPCAIKLLCPEALAAPLSRERFLREARAAARLRSDHVARVFDVGELDDGTPYMVMEYVEGTDLEEIVRERGPLPPEEAALYMIQVCAAVAEAHKLGIVHRDLKPANVIVTRDSDGTPRIKLVDFGISKLLHDPDGADPLITLEGAIMGTPAFMAPEQIGAGAVDARTDIWALGAVLYHLVTGSFPFAASRGGMTSLAAVLTRPATPPSRYVPDLPPAIEQLILHCLEKHPRDRPATVGEVASALAPFAGSDGEPLSQRVRRICDSIPDGPRSQPDINVPRLTPVTVQLATPAAPAPSSPARRRLAAVAIALGLIALVAGTVGASRAVQSTAPASPAAPSMEVAPVEAPPPPEPKVAPSAIPAASEIPSARPAVRAPKEARPPPSPGFNLHERR